MAPARWSRREVLGRVARGGAGSVLLRALPWGVGAAVLGWPRKSYASVVLDTANPLANFRQETLTGQHIFPTPTVLTVQDIGNNDVNTLIANDPDAATDIDLDLVVVFDVSIFVNINADTGVRFVINDGVKAAYACCIIKDGLQGIGIARNYPVFLPVNWSVSTTLRFRRTAQGTAQIVELNGVAPSPPAILDALPVASHGGEQTVEFGCSSVEAQATLDVVTFRSERAVIPVTIKIKPGSTEPSINVGSAGVIPVAILSSPTFDATQVNPASVSLAGAKVRLIGKAGRYSASFTDVNNDGLLDLLCHVETAQFLLEPGESMAVLEAQTFGGRAIRGQEIVRIVP